MITKNYLISYQIPYHNGDTPHQAIIRLEFSEDSTPQEISDMIFNSIIKSYKGPHKDDWGIKSKQILISNSIELK
jgi:hypothetical protein